jgi:hypothetical protein
MMAELKILSISGYETASKYEGYRFSSTSRLANYDGVTEQKPSHGITGGKPPIENLLCGCPPAGHIMVRDGEP